MYWQRIVLTPEDAEEIRCGTFDAGRIVDDICKRTPKVAGRLIDPVVPDILATGDGEQMS